MPGCSEDAWSLTANRTAWLGVWELGGRSIEGAERRDNAFLQFCSEEERKTRKRINQERISA